MQNNNATQEVVVTPPVEVMKMQPTRALTLETFNTTTGFGADVLDSIMSSAAREESKERRKRAFEDTDAGVKELFVSLALVNIF